MPSAIVGCPETRQGTPLFSRRDQRHSSYLSTCRKFVAVRTGTHGNRPQAEPSIKAISGHRRGLGTGAMVGIRDEGSISEYLAKKTVREGAQGWLHRAVTEVFSG